MADDPVTLSAVNLACGMPLPDTQGPPTAYGGEPRRMLTEAELLALVPLGRSTLFRLMADGKFPRGTFVSANRRLWFADEILRWQNAVNERDPLRGRGKGRRPHVSPSRT
jgi:predicted DNA-binding transcriptional regulator AlpA